MQILFGSIPSIVMMYITGVLEEMVKDLWQDTFVPCICKFEISMILSRGKALAVFLPDKVAKNINLITIDKQPALHPHVVPVEKK